MTDPEPPPEDDQRGVAHLAAAALVTLRWWIIAFWVGVTFVLLFVLSPISPASGGGSSLAELVPTDTGAVTTELREVQQFGFPLSGRTVIVQHDDSGLSVYAQARAVVAAAAVTKGKEHSLRTVRGALPLTNSIGLLPEAGQRDTTAITYLLFDPDRSVTSQTNTAERYIEHFFGPRDHVVGVTGTVPARAAQGGIITDALGTVELSTLLAVMLIIGFALRSVVAPVVTLLAAGVAYVATLRIISIVTAALGVSAPSELEPVIVALLLGVTTDYVVFYLSALRGEMAQGHDRLVGATNATRRFGPIVVVAGLAVALGTAVLLLAHSGFFRALGPALAITVLVALVVATTLVPALMAVLGRWCFFPSHPHGSSSARRRTAFVERLTASRERAGAVVAGCVVLLVLAASPLLHLSLGVSLVGSLPADTGIRQAADAASAGIAPGILSPTTIVLEGHRVDQRPQALRDFEQELATQPGVAGVIGPSDLGQRLSRGVMVTKDGSAARYLVVLDQEALGGAAISILDDLQQRLPQLISVSGLERNGPLNVGVAGDTAAGAAIVDQTQGDLLRIALAALAANMLMLVLFLRALVVAPFLLVGSLLSLGAALGLTSLIFSWTDPGVGLTFYVPFAAAVLLLAFGSDYNIYAVGSVWAYADRGSLRAALRHAMPEVMAAMLIAGLTLAASFGLLSVVPLLPFRELAVAMAIGIMVDVLLVRSVLLPAMLTLLGPVSSWPSHRFGKRPTRPAPEGRAG